MDDDDIGVSFDAVLGGRRPCNEREYYDRGTAATRGNLGTTAAGTAAAGTAAVAHTAAMVAPDAVGTEVGVAPGTAAAAGRAVPPVAVPPVVEQAAAGPTALRWPQALRQAAPRPHPARRRRASVRKSIRAGLLVFSLACLPSGGLYLAVIRTCDPVYSILYTLYTITPFESINHPPAYLTWTDR